MGITSSARDLDGAERSGPCYSAGKFPPSRVVSILKALLKAQLAEMGIDYGSWKLLAMGVDFLQDASEALCV